ncbi:MAG: phosphatase PAP2 family protein [Paludibacter sp.]|nr:phosphatase PAP2 family protein [Paludibacter sp.]
MRKFTIFILLISNFFVVTPGLSAQNADIDLLKKINQTAPGLRPVSIFITETANPISLAIPIGMGAYSLISKDKDLFKDAFYIAFSSGVNLGMTELLKRSIRRERPATTYPGELYIYEIRTDYAMPSGHTSGAFATATALSLKYPEWYVIVPAYVWASSVGFSRMHLGLHYPTDVLAGAALGAGSAFITYKINEWLWDNYDIKGWRIMKK